MARIRIQHFIVILLAGVLFWVFQPVRANHVVKKPYKVVQPDGDTLHCFITGDEFYRRLHDSAGYTIVCNPLTKYYVYAALEDGHLVATSLVAGRVDPRRENLTPGLCEQRPVQSRRLTMQGKTSVSPAKGTVNHLVIAISFSDVTVAEHADTVFSMFNDTLPGAVSMHNFYRNASYGQLQLFGYLYPLQAAGTTVLSSVADPYPCGYYRFATVDPRGYSTDKEGKKREHAMLTAAIAAVAPTIDPKLVLDADNDHVVDNVTFLLAGPDDLESDILWPHQYEFDPPYPKIGTLDVEGYVICLAEDLEVSTLAHETFHAMGAYDLYRLSKFSNITPVGEWDLMADNGPECKQMNAYQKEKYGKWQKIPRLEHFGIYTLRPLNAGASEHTAYRIASEDSLQEFVLEYRRRHTRDDYLIPGSGLLVYRTDKRYDGNVHYNGTNKFDEVFILHPQQGSDRIDEAAMHPATRDLLTKTTDPAPTLTDGRISDSIRIEHIVVAGDSLRFYYGPQYAQHLHTYFTADTLGSASPRTVQLTDDTSSDGDVTFRRWTIEGGIPSAIEGVREVKAYFRKPGTYRITLRTANSYKTDSMTRSVTIR